MQGFRARLAAGELLAGSFVKTPAHHGVEIAGAAGLDFVVVDAEHAPFSSETVDRCALAGIAAGIAVLVRVPHAGSPMIQQALDLGAAGVVVPHISSPAEARSVVERARFNNSARGYSNSVRAAGFGRMGMAEFMRHSDDTVAVMVQIEDRQGVAEAAAIAALDGVDALFVGRADLAVAMGAAGSDDPAVLEASAAVARAAKAAGKACGTFAIDGSRLAEQAALGMSFFVIGSDQSAMRAGWEQTARDLAAIR
jgi:2-keto-3-deoxy-L-rhamnonate aldolase RhmA